MSRLKFGPVLLAMLAGCACMVGPKYKRPPAPAPPAYKEATPDAYKEFSGEWQPANPNDGTLKGKWWEVYKDPALNDLEEQVNISNQNVLAAEANFREARAAVRIARSALFPTITTSPGLSVSRGGGGAVNSTTGQVNSGSSIGTYYNLPVDFTWQADIWGAIRRSVTAAANQAQASAADLENARLTYQAALAEDYFELHGVDAEKRLLTMTVNAYQRSFELTKFRYESGIASQGDVALAETQLDTARAQLIGVDVQRSQYEHAIAMLVGKTPAETSIPEVPLATKPPLIPPGLPSQLLERRPDIAASERGVAAANEQIGIAKAAFYPNVTLSAAAGFAASSFVKWLSWPSRFWSVGPGLAETLFDAGKRRATVAQVQAAYDSTVATYRQTVLAAFQQVEDNLAAQRILGQQDDAQAEAVRASEHSLDVITAQYESGTTDYLSVISAQATLFGNQNNAVAILISRMTASVILIEALGGGWNASELPSPHDLSHSQ